MKIYYDGEEYEARGYFDDNGNRQDHRWELDNEGIQLSGEPCEIIIEGCEIK